MDILETSTQVDRVETFIRSRGLELPAIMLLEMYKPVIRLGRVLTPLCHPLLDIFLGNKLAFKLETFLSTPGAVEILISKLEQRHGN